MLKKLFRKAHSKKTHFKPIFSLQNLAGTVPTKVPGLQKTKLVIPPLMSHCFSPLMMSTVWGLINEALGGSMAGALALQAMKSGGGQRKNGAFSCFFNQTRTLQIGSHIHHQQRRWHILETSEWCVFVHHFLSLNLVLLFCFGVWKGRFDGFWLIISWSPRENTSVGVVESWSMPGNNFPPFNWSQNKNKQMFLEDTDRWNSWCCFFLFFMSLLIFHPEPAAFLEAAWWARCLGPRQMPTRKTWWPARKPRKQRWLHNWLAKAGRRGSRAESWNLYNGWRAPKWCFGSCIFFPNVWPFLVSMLNFWGASYFGIARSFIVFRCF